MSIFIEDEVDVIFNFNYRETIEDIINLSLDYVRCPYESEVNVILTDNVNIQMLNKEYRNIDSATDVLSFPFIEYDIPADFSKLDGNIQEYFNPESGELILGDIVISIEKVISQAEEYGHSEIRELAFLTAHSMLHLFGYDHIKENEQLTMEKMQKDILDKLEIYR